MSASATRQLPASAKRRLGAGAGRDRRPPTLEMALKLGFRGRSGPARVKPGQIELVQAGPGRVGSGRADAPRRPDASRSSGRRRRPGERRHRRHRRQGAPAGRRPAIMRALRCAERGVGNWRDGEMEGWHTVRRALIAACHCTAVTRLVIHGHTRSDSGSRTPAARAADRIPWTRPAVLFLGARAARAVPRFGAGPRHAPP